MSRRRRSARRTSFKLSNAIQGSHPRLTGYRRNATAGLEQLEPRVLFSAAFDVTQLTNLRADPNYSNINGQGIGIAVLDTGVYAQNPDLQSNVVAFYDAVEQPVTQPEDPNFLIDSIDHEGHGSHVSGTAASSNPAIGVAYGAHLIDIRVFSDPGENQLGGDPIDRGLQWVQLHASQYNIKVVNMSLGEQAERES